MNFLSVLILCTLFLATLIQGEDFNSFISLVKKYQRDYLQFANNDNPLSHPIVAQKFKNYQSNLIELERVRKLDPSATYEMNQFFDWSKEDFRSRKLMPKRNPKLDSQWMSKPIYSPQETTAGELPNDFDWRKESPSPVGRVRDQGSCGSCWAWSAIQSIEGAYVQSGGNYTEYSVMALIACDHLDCDCRGGWHWRALDYIISERNGHVELDSEYPYTVPPFGHHFVSSGNETYCGKVYHNYTCPLHQKPYQFKNIPPKNAPRPKVVSYTRLPDDADAIAKYLMENGPLAVCLNAMYFQFYSRGVSNPFWCDPEGIDHCVLMTGFGVHQGIFGKTPYFILKNEWGEDWGMTGYIWMARNKCGVTKMALYPKVELEQ